MLSRPLISQSDEPRSHEDSKNSRRVLKIINLTLRASGIISIFKEDFLKPHRHVVIRVVIHAYTYIRNTTDIIIPFKRQRTESTHG